MLNKNVNLNAANTDESLPALQELLENGFDKVIWRWNGTNYDICSELDGQEWTLEEFLEGLIYEAPIFERSHVNCGCHLEVENTTTGETQIVNWQGLVF